MRTSRNPSSDPQATSKSYKNWQVKFQLVSKSKAVTSRFRRERCPMSFLMSENVVSAKLSRRCGEARAAPSRAEKCRGQQNGAHLSWAREAYVGVAGAMHTGTTVRQKVGTQASSNGSLVKLRRRGSTSTTHSVQESVKRSGPRATNGGKTRDLQSMLALLVTLAGARAASISHADVSVAAAAIRTRGRTVGRVPPPAFGVP